jgi:hypothetical protein
MKTLLLALCIVAASPSFAEEKLPRIDKNEALYCAKYGTFVADAAKLRDKGTSISEMVVVLHTNYPDADDAFITEALYAATSFKDYSPDWIGGFITGKCVGLTQSRKAKYIPL